MANKGYSNYADRPISSAKILVSFFFFLEHVRYDTQILTIFFFCSSYFELRGWNVEIRHDL